MAASRMSSAEAIMWAAERDPVLRSSFSNLTFLDRAPDFARFRARMERAARVFPRLRQRVAGTPVGPPEWADDPDFDLDYHVRRVALPPPGGDRQFLDLAAVLGQDPFDPVRPLWRFTVVEGLDGGRAALIATMDHAITDGVGGVRLSAEFIDLAPDAPEREPVAPPDSVEAGDGNVLGRAVRQLVGTATAVAGAIGGPGNALDTARSLARQALITDAAHSPLWAGRRSLRRHYEILRADLDEVKGAANKLGGTVNDVYITGVAGAAGAYHRAKGAEVDELRMSMPVSTRADRSAGGNAFAPSRVLVPAGIEDPRERFAAVHQRLTVTKGERSLALANSFAGVISGLPNPLLVRLARQQVETVDFAASNLRGAPVDLWIAGAHILSNHPMGPTGGTAFNVTLLSYKGSMDIGINSDAAAVDDPALLCDCIAESLAEVVAAAG